MVDPQAKTEADDQGERRAWQRMLSGRRLNLFDPSPLDIELDDIAIGLARVPRWNGQTKGEWAFSVAQHALLVEGLLDRFRRDVPPLWRLLALLHDAPEYVIGDLITPFKSALGGDYRSIEQGLMQAIRLRFGLARLPKAADALVKRADRAAAFIEAQRLAGFPPADARRFFDSRGLFQDLDWHGIDVEPWSPKEAQAQFLARFQDLSEQP
ncbi:MAG: hypothetical protein ACR2Q4_02870 [Geminicoccaceae bacterium]